MKAIDRHQARGDSIPASRHTIARKKVSADDDDGRGRKRKREESRKGVTSLVKERFLMQSLTSCVKRRRLCDEEERMESFLQNTHTKSCRVMHALSERLVVLFSSS